MKKRPNPELIDDDAPEWTDDMAARAVPFAGLPAKLQRKLRGRPVVGQPKTAISLRVPNDALARWKASGAGWQTRMAQALAEQAPRAR
jgi:uncharacterized protein (DUF4415 family)